MPPNKKITEIELLSHLQEGGDLLAPLRINRVELNPLSTQDRGIDALVVASLPDEEEAFRFVIEAKSSSTPKSVHGATAQARAYVRQGEHPMILVPYLSPQRLKELEHKKISGIDLCGNGIVIIPERLIIFRTGNKNRYPESRPLSNPYRGRSAMVGRALLVQAQYDTLSELYDVIQESGAKLSLSQVSKAVKALEDELIVSSSGRAMRLKDPLRLLDRLGSEWRAPRAAKMALRLPEPLESLSRLSHDERLKWAITGESSVTKYISFGQGRPLRVAVSNLRKAWEILDGDQEDIPNFADVELIETSEAGFYFQNRCDPNEIRWASRLQTWIELHTGDGRQQDAAREIRQQIITRINQWQ